MAEFWKIYLDGHRVSSYTPVQFVPAQDSLCWIMNQRLDSNTVLMDEMYFFTNIFLRPVFSSALFQLQGNIKATKKYAAF